ncbi:YkyA family protein [Salipaludibacillus aurantiacus]|uniref:Putative cell-wall binding lipoprotein n=1 Tax=Salipaludibacillus aurantiacus TaxID=1601833 RepID=A0A1H9WZQ4_9BACI|nr:YkyA family protein [Salipaludibacillus aurantiacus]SES39412.1 Putative cell-wall binding lipoprotein [Salipaludibacillus aurantiacus]
MKKILTFLGASAALVFTSGCFGDDSVEQMYEKFEESVEIENQIEDKQEPLVDAEQTEMNLYEEMLTLSSVEEIEPLADEAIESAEERRTLMEEEENLIEESFVIFQEAEEHLEDIDEEEVRTAGENVVQTMHERYEVYQELFNTYMTSIDEDIALYEMIKDEDAEAEELQEQHETVNDIYGEISSLNEEFNQLTNEYNEAKMEFYRAADLNVADE